MVPRSSRICYSILDRPQASIRTLRPSRLAGEVGMCGRPSVGSNLPRRVSQKGRRTLSWSVGERLCSPRCVRCRQRRRQGAASEPVLPGCSSGRPRLSLAGDDAGGRATAARCTVQPLRRTLWSVFCVCSRPGEDHPGWGVAWARVLFQRNAWL